VIIRPGIVAAAKPGGGGGYVGPLDINSAALVAYSQRRMAAAFAGNVIQIDNGSSSQDFAASSNNAVDPAAITTFIGGGTGTISKWYDQSSNSADLAPTGPNTGPIGPIWGASLFGGKPGFTSSRAAGQLLGANKNTTFATGQFTVFLVYIITSGLNENAPFGANVIESTHDGYLDVFITDQFLAQKGWCVDALDDQDNECGGYTDTGTADSLQHVMDAAWQFGSRSLALDGAAAIFSHVTDTGPLNSFAAPFAVCDDDAMSNSGGFDGSIAEILVYDSILSADRIAIRQNIAEYYGITLS